MGRGSSSDAEWTERLQKILAREGVKGLSHPVEVYFNRQEIGNNTPTEGARLDVPCLGIWGPLEKTLMDVRIFHPCAPSYMSKSIEKQEKDIQRPCYQHRKGNVRTISILNTIWWYLK